MTTATRYLTTIFKGIVLAIMLFAVVLPLVWMVSTSFKRNNEILVFPPKLWADNPTMDNFARVFSEGSWAFLSNSLVAAGASTVLTVALAAPAAYALAAHRFPRDVGRLISAGFLVLRFLPPFAIVIPLFILFRQVGLLDSLWALILTYTAFHLPLAVWIIQPAVQALPGEISEAAAVDGANPLRVFWSIVLPLIRPALATAAAICTIFSWNEFFFALVFTNKSARTYPLLINSFISDMGPEWGLIAATSLLAILPIAILFIALQKHLVSGMLAGAIR